MNAFLTLILAVFVHVATVQSGPGQWEDLDVNSPEVKAAAVPAMKAINDQSNSISLLILIEIQAARGQVVKGMNYMLKLLASQSDCKKNEVIGRLEVILR